MLKKNGKKIGIITLVVALICSLYVNISQAVPTASAEPGSDDDPIVSKSYVDTSLQENYTKLLQEMNTLKDQISGGGSKGFETVSIKAGQVMLPGGGTEILLRSGKATAIKGAGGGLADTTAAKDLVNGAAVSTNHLLISSRDDGRGLKAVNDCWVLVRGAYKLQGSTSTETNNGGSNQTDTKNTGVVNISTLNIREQPNTSSAILAKAMKGDVLEILSEADN